MCAYHRVFNWRSLLGITLISLLAATNAGAQADPPGRVARLSYGNGNLSFEPAGTEQWLDADFNRPLTTGDSLWVPRAGRAELHIGSSTVRLNEKSDLSFLTLSDDAVQLKMTQGAMLLRLRSLAGKEVFEIDTPNLAFSLQEAGEYKIIVNDDNTTTVIVRRGAGIAYGDHDSITLREAEQATFSGTNLAHSSISRMSPYDAFDLWANDRDRAEDGSVSARYVSRDVIGYQQLDDYGIWETHAEYGAIWFPRVTVVGWAPYRIGHWLWVAPWGWTWIDQAPWGFAPYHYGRWAYIGSRWAWVPGHHLRDSRPVYAPALVAFVGAQGGNASLNISAGRSHVPAVAWLPLAPGEVYRPGYAASSRYISNLNQNVTINNTTIVNNNRTMYVNQHLTNAVTAIPATTFSKGQAVAPVATSMNSQQLSNVQIGTAAPSLVPPKDSLLGVARRVAVPEGNQSMHRPVIATIRPAEVPAPHPGVLSQTAPEPRSTAPNATVPMPGVMLHNPVRGENAGRTSVPAPGRAVDVAPPVDGRAANPATGITPQTAMPVQPANRQRPDQVVPPEQRRGGNMQNRMEGRDTESVNRPFDNPRASSNAQASIRTEPRKEIPAPPAVTSPLPRESAYPQPQRSMERPAVVPQSVAPTPRAERAVISEPRKEAPAASARQEKEREHKEKADTHNSQGMSR